MERLSIKINYQGSIDELERCLKEDDLSLFQKLAIEPYADDMDSHDLERICALLETLNARCGEMKTLQQVLHNGEGPQEILEATASLAHNCPAVQCVNWAMQSLSLTEKVVQACCASHVTQVEISFGNFNKESMGRLCKGLCARNEPLHALILHGSFDRDAVDIFASALPRMRLGSLILSLTVSAVPYVQEDYQRVFRNLAECLDLRNVILDVMRKPHGHLDGPTPMSFDEPVFSTILEAIPRMISLRKLSWYGTVQLTRDQWFRMGKTVAECPHMTILQLNGASNQAEADAFFDGCGPHPRLLHVELGNYNSFCLARVRRWQTLRAKCLTVLLVGRSIERAGAHSSVYKVPIDIFRRLHSFLPEEDD